MPIAARRQSATPSAKSIRSNPKDISNKLGTAVQSWDAFILGRPRLAFIPICAKFRLSPSTEVGSPQPWSLCREEEEGLTFPARIDNAVQLDHWVAILSSMVFADLGSRCAVGAISGECRVLTNACEDRA
jgi:hypothetical protein